MIPYLYPDIRWVSILTGVEAYRMTKHSSFSHWDLQIRALPWYGSNIVVSNIDPKRKIVKVGVCSIPATIDLRIPKG